MKEKILISREEIDVKVRELATCISADYADNELVCLGILNGAVVFFSDLIRQISIDIYCGFVGFSSYENNINTHNLKYTLPLTVDVKDKHVLVVEDIIDTGVSISRSQIYTKLFELGALSVKLCALLSKPSKRIDYSAKIDYLGFEIPDIYVYGYGMDNNGLYRNLDCIKFLE